MESYEYRVHEDHRRRGAYDIIPGLPGDMNFTVHVPGVIPEELHMHHHQTDYFVVAHGKVLFRLVYDDGRPEEKFIVTEQDKKTVIIPPEVWHGYLAIEPSTMIFYITQKFNTADELRRKCSPEDWSYEGM